MAKNNNDINEKLKDHEQRITSLEKLLNNTKKPKMLSNNQSLSDRIIEMRDNDFFSKPKTAEETHTKLNAKYPCELNRVAVALLRLAGKKQLRIISKNVGEKKYKAYAW